ncbi:uncharacterized protein LOC112084414 [Eutrema salsugineum]|uniref:uncharacterized protein LOC112084414 n=1 Tax=Eutrema salsugineum TaxID=72664 RepID=UPI000CED64F3|nr:uncharacterized protein LOC112084414 [Eutrema salsugineum]
MAASLGYNKLTNAANFHCTATIDAVEQLKSWYYIACTTCNTKAIRGPTSLVCNKCNNHNAIGVIKYRVEISVSDNNNKATFVLLDDAGTQLIGRKAAEIVEDYVDAVGVGGAGDNIPLPESLNDAIAKTYIFKVKVDEYNFSAARQTITVTKIVQPADLPKMPSPNTRAELEDKNSDTLPQTKSTKWDLQMGDMATSTNTIASSEEKTQGKNKKTSLGSEETDENKRPRKNTKY